MLLRDIEPQLKYEQLHFINYQYIALDSFSIVNINLAGNMVWLICNKMQKKTQGTYLKKTTIQVWINLHT